MKRTIEVTIMGQKFMVRSESDESYVQRVAEFVNNRVIDISAKTKAIPSLQVVMLAAMNIADDLLRHRDDHEKTVGGMQKKIEGMIELIDLQL